LFRGIVACIFLFLSMKDFMKRGLRLLVGMSLMLQVTSLMPATPDSDAGIDVDEIALLAAAASSVSLTDATSTRTPTPGCFEVAFELNSTSASLRSSPVAGSPTKLCMRAKTATCVEEALDQLCEKFSFDKMFLVILTEYDDTGLSDLQLNLDAHYCYRSALAMLSKDYDKIPNDILETTVRTHLQTVVDAILACLKEYAVSGAMLTIWAIPGMQPIVFPADTSVECLVFSPVPGW
jgi:hypothetical protein